MMRVLELTEHFAVKTFIIINKFDINKEVTEKILHFAKEKNIKVMGKIPFDKRVNDSLMENKTIVSLGKGPAFKAILDFWKCLQEELK
jgi:MinD superfamily P-loop ATPase